MTHKHTYSIPSADDQNDARCIECGRLQPTTQLAKHTPGPWIAIKGDTFNPERPWGVSKYLSREAHIEIDGDDKEYPCRTEVIAELTETENPQEVEHTAYLIAAAPAMYEALVETMRVLRSLRDSKEEWYTLVTPELLNVWDRNKQAISQAEGRHHE